MNNITYFITVHNLESLNYFLNYKNNNDILKDVNFKYICGVNPKRTNIFNQSIVPIISSYDESLYSQNNNILRQHSTYMYILKNIDKIETDFISIEGCTTVRLERDKFNHINNDTIYTTIRKSEYIKIPSNKDKEKLKLFFHSCYNIDKLENYFFLFDYLIFNKKIASDLYDFFKENIDILLKSKPYNRIFLPEYFDACLYYKYKNSVYKDKFKVDNLHFKFNCFDRKIPGLHYYG